MIPRERIEVLASDPAAGHRIGAPPTDAEVRELAQAVLRTGLVIEVGVSAGLVSMRVRGEECSYKVLLHAWTARNVGEILIDQARWIEQAKTESTVARTMSQRLIEALEQRKDEGR